MKIFLIFFMSPLTLAAIYDFIFYIPSSLLGDYPDLGGRFTIYIFIQIIMYLIFSCYFIIKYNDVRLNVCENKKVYIDKGFSNIIYIVFLCICFSLFLFLFYNVFNDFNFINLVTQNGKFYARSKIGTAWIFYLYQFFLFIMLYDMYVTKISRLKLVVFILCVVIIGVTGGRSTIISYIVFIFFILIVVQNRRVSKVFVFVGAIFFVVVFMANAVLRSGSDNDSSIERYINSGALILDFNNSFIVQDTVDYIDNSNDFYLVAFDDLYYAFMPRKFVPDKPVSTAETRLVYKDMLSDGRTTNITFGVYANMLINLGYVGFLLAPLALIFSNYYYIRLCMRIHERRAKDFIALYFFMMFILVLRGGFINVRIILSLIMVVAAVIFYEFMRRVKV